VALAAWRPGDEAHLDSAGKLRDLELTKESMELYQKFSTSESTKVFPVHLNLVKIV
jgi:hypothetical protein